MFNGMKTVFNPENKSCSYTEVNSGEGASMRDSGESVQPGRDLVSAGQVHRTWPGVVDSVC